MRLGFATPLAAGVRVALRDWHSYRESYCPLVSVRRERH
jgi:hypothetical protein